MFSRLRDPSCFLGRGEAHRPLPLVLLGALLFSACENGKEPTASACDLMVGELAVSEIMANPLGDERAGEWIEIYNTTSRVVALNRLLISATAGSGVDTHEVLDAADLEPHAYFVLGNGPLTLSYLDYTYGSALNLADSATLTLRCNDVVVDTVAYGGASGAPPPEEGRSLSVDGAVAPDSMLNDDRTYWCSGSEVYDDSNRGTPGAANTACGFAGCTENGELRDIAAPAAGDLIVTEVLADPAGADTDKEWIEIYVAAATAVDLNGVSIEIAKSDGSSPKSFTIVSTECIAAAPGDRIVVGASADRAVNGNVPVNVVIPGFTVVNGSELDISLWRGTELIDETTLPAAQADKGISVRLDDGRTTGDGNDVPEAFCDAAADQTGAFDGVGTPGAANDLCAVFTCREGEIVRAVRPPAAGALVISEVLADPAGSDTNKEWLELYVASATAFDLNGLVIDITAGTSAPKAYSLLASDCLIAAPGSYVVIGASKDTTVNGGVVVTAAAPGLTMVNNQELRARVWRETTLIDEATVPAAPNDKGIAIRLDEGHNTASDNDLAKWFCEAGASQTGVPQTRGTPGGANGLCGIYTCRDGGGTIRDVVPAAAAGDLLVTEVYAQPPAGGTGTAREWIEVYVAAAAAIDLNALTITVRKTASTTKSTFRVESESCVRGAPGDYLVLAGSKDPLQTGSVTVDGVVPDLTLQNADPLTLELVAGTLVVDEASVPGSKEGRSQSLDAESLTLTGNDVATSFCPDSSTGNFEGQGTPGLPNHLCGAACMAGTVERRPVSPAVGELVITEIMANPSGTDDGRDWIELYINGTRAIDLNGVEISCGTGKWTLTAVQCISVDPAASHYIVIGGVNAVNDMDGVAPVATFGAAGDSLLSQAGCAMSLGVAGTVIDSAAAFASQAEGRALALDADILTPGDNDVAANWCPAATSIHLKPAPVQYGSPGFPNPGQATGAAQCQ